MHRPRRHVPLVSLAATLTIGPVLAGMALAADPVTVRPGDTLTGISGRHGVPIAQIVRLNELPDPNRIYAGQRLRLEADTPRAPQPSRPRTPDAQPTETAHTIRSGEHLTGIARRYGVSVAEIVAANGIANPSRVYAGQRLVIPGQAPAPSGQAPAPVAAPADKAHTIRSGEHLTGIARRYGVSVSQIVAANGIADPSRVYVGQRLVIPGTAPAQRAPAPAAAVPSSMAALMAKRNHVRSVITEEARRFDVPVTLALAVAWQESGWRQEVVSHAGAIGVMQVMPATGEWVGEAMLGSRIDLRDTRQNVRAGVRLLRHYLDRYRGNLDLVLAAYYQGQAAADRHGVFPVSRPYVASIRALVGLLDG